MEYKKKLKLRKSLKDAGRLDLFYKCVYYDMGTDEDGDPLEVKDYDYSDI